MTDNVMCMRHDVEFRVEDGTLLRGLLHSVGGGPAPAIVMAHGFSGVKEQVERQGHSVLP